MLKNRAAFQKTLLILVLSHSNLSLIAKDYKGAELRTYTAYTYGRFEVNYRASFGAGQTSTFFTYHELSGGLDDWNEIDIEMLGRYSDDIQFNTITSGQTNHVHHQFLPFDPTADYHTYAIEWTPEYVAWFVDNVEVYRQTGAHITTLNKPQKIMMNIWPPAYSDWVGLLDERYLPFQAYYDWVSYASYTPGNGNCGTGNNFTLQWRDDFDSWNTNRWAKATHTWQGNNCDFIAENCVFRDGKMILCLTDATNIGFTDKRAPALISATFFDDTVTVCFSERLNRESAEKKSNYSIANVTITSATLQPDYRTVKLAVSGINPSQSYTLAALGIKDQAPVPNTLTGQVVNIKMPPNWQFPLKINVGGDATGDWLADQDWTPYRDYGRLGGAQNNFLGQAIGGTSEQLVFQTEQVNIVNYKVRLPKGNYQVTLLFAENSFQAVGERVFEINVEGNYAIRDLDIFKEVGAHQAYYYQLGTIPVTDGLLDIHFGDRQSSPILNGLIIEQVAGLKGSLNSRQPSKFELQPNFPNPFNCATTLRFAVDQPAWIKIAIYNLLGVQVAAPYEAYFTPGWHNLTWQPNLPSGQYFARFETINQNRTVYAVQKLTLLR